MTTERRDALTELIQRHVGTHRGGKWTVAAFAKASVDPDSGYSPSSGLVGKIVKGGSYTVTPELISALAVGLSVPREVVGAAAHFQIIGYSPSELDSGQPAQLLARLDAEPGVGERAVVHRWDRDELSAGGPDSS